MEPDDIPVHDLLGAGGQPEPGPDELRAIVARAGRRRLQIAAVGAAVALAAGGGIGYGLSNHSTPATQTATAPSSASSPNSGSKTASGSSAGSGAYNRSGSVAGPAVAYPPLTRLFTRTTGGITIRGFLLKVSKPLPAMGMPTGCGIGSAQLQVEASTVKMVGIVDGWSPDGVQSQLLGVAEGDPTGVVTVATTSKVTEVSMSFVGGATDKMAPVNGWVALAAPVSGTLQYGKPMGTLTESGSSGKVVKSQAVALGGQTEPAIGVPCGVFCPAVGSAPPVPANGGVGPGVPAPAIACAMPACPPPLRQLSPPKGAPVTGAPINGTPSGSPSGGASSSGGTTVSGAVSSGKASSTYLCPRLYPPGAGTSSGSAATGSAATGSAATGWAGSAP